MLRNHCLPINEENYLLSHHTIIETGLKPVSIPRSEMIYWSSRPPMGSCPTSPAGHGECRVGGVKWNLPFGWEGVENAVVMHHPNPDKPEKQKRGLRPTPHPNHTSQVSSISNPGVFVWFKISYEIGIDPIFGVTAKKQFGGRFPPNSALKNSVKDHVLTFLQGRQYFTSKRSIISAQQSTSRFKRGLFLGGGAES